MLIFEHDKIVCYKLDNRLIPAANPGELSHRNYCIYFTIQVNGTLKNIRTVLGQYSDGTYRQEGFVAAINILKELGYNISGEDMTSIYDEVTFEGGPQLGLKVEGFGGKNGPENTEVTE